MHTPLIKRRVLTSFPVAGNVMSGGDDLPAEELERPEYDRGPLDLDTKGGWEVGTWRDILIVVAPTLMASAFTRHEK